MFFYANSIEMKEIGSGEHVPGNYIEYASLWKFKLCWNTLCYVFQEVLF